MWKSFGILCGIWSVRILTIQADPIANNKHQVGIRNLEQSSYESVEEDKSWSVGDSFFNGDYSSLTEISLNDDDVAQLSLPFDFPFFGKPQNTAYLSSNGLISFYNVASRKLKETSKASLKEKTKKASHTPVEPEGGGHSVDKKDVKYIVSLKRDAIHHIHDVASVIDSLHRDDSRPDFSAEISHQMHHLGLLVIKSPSPGALQHIRADPRVASVREDRMYHIDPIRADPIDNTREGDVGVAATSTYSWGLDRIDQADLPLDRASYSAPSYTNSGQGVNVFVMDTGIDTTHQEFASDTCTRTVQNIFNAFGSVVANTDGHGHGTHVSGTIGGKNVGVAKCANVFGMKVLSDSGSGYDSDILEAFDYVLNLRVNDNTYKNSPLVVSMSLGGDCGTSCSEDALVMATATLSEHGIVVVVAAGNEAQDACLTSPAAAASAITVGATDRYDSLASYSNYGRCVDILAPGSSILSACSSTSSMTCDSGNSKYLTISGTSMATPHVSGVVALWLAMTSPKVYNSSLPNDASTSLKCDGVWDTITLWTINILDDFLQTPYKHVSSDFQTECPLGVYESYCCEGGDLSDSYNPPYGAIAFAWIDLNPSDSSSAVYVGPVDNYMYAVVFDQVPLYGISSSTISVEVILFDTGDFQIFVVDNSLGSYSSYMTVGFKGPYDGNGVEYIQWYGPGVSSALPESDSFYISTGITIVNRTSSPTRDPTMAPSRKPTNQPSSAPSKIPTYSPTWKPTAPTVSPTVRPTRSAPTRRPTVQRSSAPSKVPTYSPTRKPTAPTVSPTIRPTRVITQRPTRARRPAA